MHDQSSLHVVRDARVPRYRRSAGWVQKIFLGRKPTSPIPRNDIHGQIQAREKFKADYAMNLARQARVLDSPMSDTEVIRCIKRHYDKETVREIKITSIKRVPDLVRLLEEIQEEKEINVKTREDDKVGSKTAGKTQKESGTTNKTKPTHWQRNRFGGQYAQPQKWRGSGQYRKKNKQPEPIIEFPDSENDGKKRESAKTQRPRYESEKTNNPNRATEKGKNVNEINKNTTKKPTESRNKNRKTASVRERDANADKGIREWMGARTRDSNKIDKRGPKRFSNRETRKRNREIKYR